jgi:hypothetical protein
MDSTHAERHVVLALDGPGCSEASSGRQGITGIRQAVMRLGADERGWPLVDFEPDDPALRLVRDFLRSDVDISLPSCDLLLVSVAAVMSGEQERWRWNGNSFLLGVERFVSRLTDKYEDENGVYRSADLPTAVLPSLIRAWREFVFDLPRQRELEAVQRTAPAARETK